MSEQIGEVNGNHRVIADDARASWWQRTFGTMGAGSLRAQIFLLIVTTVGSSFFLLPFASKQVGLISIILLILSCALLSLSSSTMLYAGFRETKAKTYNECMTKVLGMQMGYLSNVVVFLHTFAAVLSTWIFSFKYLANGLENIFDFDETNEYFELMKFGYFAFTFLLFFFVTLGSSIEKLKFVAMLGICFLLYLIVCFIYLTPEYYHYYYKKNQLHVKFFIWDFYLLKAFGICLYVFFNQYAILPVCSNVKDATFARTSKILIRTVYTLVVIYIVLIFCGYFSEPDKTKTEIFLLREPISSDRLVLFGKVCFGVALVIAMLVKGHYLLLYFHELIDGFHRVFLKQENGNKQSQQETLVDKKEESPKAPNFNVREIPFRTKMIRNFLFLLVKMVLAILLMEKLSFILSITGSLVGVFEMVLFPSLLVIKINSNRRFLSLPVLACVYFVSSVAFIACVCSVVYNLIPHAHS